MVRPDAKMKNATLNQQECVQVADCMSSTTLPAAPGQNNPQLFRSCRIHASFSTTALGNTLRTAVMNSAKPCRCLNFIAYGFHSSAAECPSLEESMFAADDDLLNRRGGGE